jgi:CRP-like cAMP-binding protein
VFSQGDLGDSVYVIDKGRCEVLRETGGGQEHVADLGAGDYFGEMAVLADVSRSATIRALSPLDVLLIARNDFNLLKATVPAFGNVFRELGCGSSRCRSLTVTVLKSSAGCATASRS